MKILKGDGEGNLVIPGWFLTVIILAVTILSSMASVVAMGTTLRNDVDNLKEDLKESGPLQADINKAIDERLRKCENTISAIDIKLENIDSGIISLNNKLEKYYEGTQ